MSRIGLKPISLPENVSVEVNAENSVTVKGPKGELTRALPASLELSNDNGTLSLSRKNELKQTKQLHGTFRAHLNNMVEGVLNGWTKELKIVGVGYRAALAGKKITFKLGYSHEIIVEVPANLEVEVNKNVQIIVKGIDKESVGSFAANIKKLRKPDAYKGKGIRYADEIIRLKDGK